MMPPPMTIGRPKFSDEESEEYKDEDDRVQKVEALEYTVGEKDLVRLFQLPPIQPKTPPVTIRTISGTSVTSTLVFGPDGQQIAAPKEAGDEYAPKVYAFFKPAEGGSAGLGSNAHLLSGSKTVNVDRPPTNPNLQPKPPAKPKN